ncbi:MAG: SGNH/GDSL hydrolase family protein, partial [Candidatus Dormiibacterota bacterium]
MRRSGARWALAIAAGLLLAGAPQLVSAAGRPGESTSPVYYLALGDSLAQGVQVVNGAANVTNHGYVDDLFQALHKDTPNLQLVKLGCPGETTGTMISGGCPYSTYPAGSQLAQAVEFLRAHRNRVALVTIDIGANNVDGCFSATGISLSCFYQGLASVGSQLPFILRQLRSAAGPRVPIVGMNYYDPFLATYLETGGQAGAIESVGLGDLLNSLLGAVFAFNRDQVANVQATFKTNDFAPSGSPSVPTNVALICAWTYMCTDQNIHANALGYQEIAGAFEE